jgi:flagellin
MAISILYNIPSLAAENQLNVTNTGLQNTLYRLSTGSRINSGADDAAGLAIANGLQANVTALTQSALNATEGAGKLQVADGALSQVTTLLNRAVTLATESANGTINDGSQRQALDAEFTAIKAEIDRIGSNTTFNGTQVFQNATAPNLNQSATGVGGLTLATTLTDNATVTLTSGNKTYTFTANSSTLGDLVNGINSDATVGAKAYVNGTGDLVITDPANRNNLTVTSTDAVLGAFSHPNAAVPASTNIYLSDSSSSGASTISVTIGALSQSKLDYGASSVDLSGDDLTSAANAQTALADINQSIQNVSGIRGSLGATINRLQAASSVINVQTQNLSAAEDGIRSADIAAEVANLTKFNILNQTGISALAQANQAQQSILSLLR